MPRSIWPTNRISGVESCLAISSAFDAPGPRVTMQMPGSPVSLPCASAIIAAPPSWRQTVTWMSASQAVQHRQVAARHENVFDALGDQPQDVTAETGCLLGHRVSSR